jgi:solute carrier family 4 (anion exchanger) protein 1
VILKQRWRSTISDYAVPLAVVICIGISYAAKDEVEVDRIMMPRNFEPTYESEDGEKRSWYQGPGDGGFAAFVSIIAAVPIVALFYIDHLFSCILGQKPELGLKKGEYYHSSMLITGVCNLILPSFGMPFVTASLPHSPQFTKALTDYDKTKTPWEVEKVHESRVAPMLVYLLCFCGLVVPSVLELCPEGVVNGTLTFVGIQGILPGTGNQLIDRCVLLITAPSEFPESNASYAQLPWRRIHLYTLIQLACLAACWGMRFTGPFSLAFPLVIVGFIPLRLYVLPKYFTAEELAVLDSEGAESKTEKKGGEPESHADDNDPQSDEFAASPPIV